MTESNKQELKLVVPIPPSVNKYLFPSTKTIRIKGKNRTVSTMKETNECRAYKRKIIPYVIGEVIEQGWQKPEDKFKQVIINYKFYFPHTKMDTNNHYKILIDALVDTQCVALDDNIIIERVDSLLYDANNPRIELTITESESIGIFKSDAILNTFQSKCESCSRYRKGSCSILKKSKEGRIIPEIDISDEIVCNSYKLKKTKG